MNRFNNSFDMPVVKIYHRKNSEGYLHFLDVSIFLIVLFTSSCRKLVDIPQPINRITDEAAYSTDASAIAVLTGLYIKMSQPLTGGFNGESSIQICASLSSDELNLAPVTTSLNIFFQNALLNGGGYGGSSWGPLFNYIYRANAAIEGITASSTLSSSIKQQLLGEAYFLRGFYYFHLVNLFGPTPLATTTDYKKNTLLARAPISDVYQLIIADLKKAQELLSNQFLNGSINAASEERLRPTRWAATALLARVYLYCRDYSKASEQASIVINNSLFSLIPLNEVFLKNSVESIWQLQPVDAFFNTQDARIFIIPQLGFSSINPCYLNPSLVSSFEPGDLRFNYGNWVDTIMINDIPYHYPFKYKINSFDESILPQTGSKNMIEYQMVLRLGEQYLIRAEARAQQSDLAGAIADVDSIRSRAGLPLITNTNPGITKDALLDAIFHERQVELFTEWCHRWFDLKRTGRVDAVMSVETPLKGGIWESREALYPLPISELQKAPNLIQNPGYPDL